jgi:hypothetical protein
LFFLECSETSRSYVSSVHYIDSVHHQFRQSNNQFLCNFIMHMIVTIISSSIMLIYLFAFFLLIWFRYSAGKGWNWNLVTWFVSVVQLSSPNNNLVFEFRGSSIQIFISIEHNYFPYYNFVGNFVCISLHCFALLGLVSVEYHHCSKFQKQSVKSV